MDSDLPIKKNQLIDDQVADNISRVEELAYELKVQDVMSVAPRTVTWETRMQDLLELFRQERISGAPVVRQQKLIGVVSIEDLIRCLMNTDLKAPVGKYMTSENLITVRPVDPLVEALKRFVNGKVGRLPVVDDQQQLMGIITKGDITRGLLRALQKDYQTEEIRRYRASHLFDDIISDRTSLILRYNISPRDFTHGGAASSHIKRALARLGANPQLCRRCGIAVYEAEMNLIIHTTDGGVIRVEIEPHQISIEVYDYGPGIQDIELALKPGYSTASEEIRELGFGAGMGLVNISRCVDWMKLESTWGKGTRLRMKLFLTSAEGVGEGRPGTKETQS
jgi:CBS domain-containing protein/anti-sigma regulatory factor (Ser/Thr protein kinase)